MGPVASGMESRREEAARGAPEALILEDPTEGRSFPPAWEVVFGRTAPLAVEIGPGKGVFLARIAAAYREWNFVAVEIRRQRAILCARKVVAAGLENVRLVEGPAEDRVPALFRPRSVSTWYINFPDPWPKRRQRKHRLVRSPFAETLATLTVGGGVVYLATDDVDYGDQILRVFESSRGDWTNHYGPGMWGDQGGEFSRTIHEEKFLAWGRTIRYFRFVRSS